MANFNQHLSFAILGCGLAITPLLGANLIDPKSALILWISGTLGGIMPDIDSDNSTALRLIFALLCLLVTGVMLTELAGELTTPEIWLCLGGIYGLVFEGARRIFARFTVHRGIFHSLLAAGVISLMTVTGAAHLLKFSATLAWLSGLFMFVGYILHLTLDEIYSVDLMNVEIKRSFGTALKPANLRHWQSTLAMSALLLPLYAATPDHRPAWQLISSKHTLQRIQNSFAPSQWSSLSWIRQLSTGR